MSDIIEAQLAKKDKVNSTYRLAQERIRAFHAPEVTRVEKMKIRQALEGQFLGAIHNTANRFLWTGVDREDLYAAAFRGFHEAMENYDESKNVLFSAYAAKNMSFIVRNAIVEIMGVSNGNALKDLFYNYNKYLKAVQAENPEPMSADDLDRKMAEYIGRIKREENPDYSVKFETLLKAIKAARHSISERRGSSLYAPVSDGGGNTSFIDLTPDNNSLEGLSQLEKSDERAIIRAILAEAFDVLNERQKAVFIERQKTRPSESSGETHEVTLEDLASRYGLSRERIRQIEVEASVKLARKFAQIAEKRGITEFMGRDLSEEFTQALSSSGFNAFKFNKERKKSAPDARFKENHIPDGSHWILE